MNIIIICFSHNSRKMMWLLWAALGAEKFSKIYMYITLHYIAFELDV